MARARLRELGISVGQLPTGPLNAITDVAGVRIGHATLVRDTPNLVRTGVTAIWPHPRNVWDEYLYGGYFSFNGNGEMTGTIWLEEQGMISGPIGITNTYAVGVVRDGICALAVRDGARQAFHLPIVAETYDGWLSDAESFPVTQDLVIQAFDAAQPGPVAEGCVGGGTGMICHDFKGGIGTASRVAKTASGSFTVGALVQSNYGARELLRVDGVPVGQEIGEDEVPLAKEPVPARPDGSIIVILATDAPLLPIQCKRLARRATTGLAWVGGIGSNGSGDIFLAFSTGNIVHADEPMSTVRTVSPDSMTPLFLAAAEATQEAILNSMTAAETTTGFKGRTVHALPLDRLQEVMRKYRPG